VQQQQQQRLPAAHLILIPRLKGSALTAATPFQQQLRASQEAGQS
jgi:hypothetical protein